MPESAAGHSRVELDSDRRDVGSRLHQRVGNARTAREESGRGRCSWRECRSATGAALESSARSPWADGVRVANRVLGTEGPADLRPGLRNAGGRKSGPPGGRSDACAGDARDRLAAREGRDERSAARTRRGQAERTHTAAVTRGARAHRSRAKEHSDDSVLQQRALARGVGEIARTSAAKHRRLPVKPWLERKETETEKVHRELLLAHAREHNADDARRKSGRANDRNASLRPQQRTTVP